MLCEFLISQNKKRSSVFPREADRNTQQIQEASQQRFSRMGGRPAVLATQHLLWSQNPGYSFLGVLFFPFQPMSSYDRSRFCPVSQAGLQEPTLGHCLQLPRKRFHLPAGAAGIRTQSLRVMLPRKCLPENAGDTGKRAERFPVILPDSWIQPPLRLYTRYKTSLTLVFCSSWNTLCRSSNGGKASGTAETKACSPRPPCPRLLVFSGSSLFLSQQSS